MAAVTLAGTDSEVVADTAGSETDHSFVYIIPCDAAGLKFDINLEIHELSPACGRKA